MQPRRPGVEAVHDARAAAAPPALDSGTPIPSNRFTSVPARRRSVGWVISPAGLATTSRCSSSIAHGHGAAPRLRSGSCDAGSRPRCARRPQPVTTSGGPRRRRSTRPSAIARCTSARGAPERRRHHGVEPARPRRRSASGSVTWPSAASSVQALPPSPGTTQRPADRADHDGGVGEVEHRPDLQVDEVHDVPAEALAPRHPVGEVAERAPRAPARARAPVEHARVAERRRRRSARRRSP